MGEAVVCLVVPFEAAVGADPKVPLPVLKHGANGVVTQTVWIVGPVNVADEFLGFSVVPVKAVIPCSKPQGAGTVFGQALYVVPAEAVRIAGFVLKTNETTVFPIEQVQSAVRSEPEPARPVFVDFSHVVVAEAVGI